MYQLQNTCGMVLYESRLSGVGMRCDGSKVAAVGPYETGVGLNGDDGSKRVVVGQNG